VDLFIWIYKRQVAPNRANLCYNILFCYKQAAPTELIGSTFFKKLKCYLYSNLEASTYRQNFVNIRR
ncbi:MAG: hypothetical protein CV080_01375, partial [Candidatus Kuenenia stuttgartiensis]